MWRCGVKVRYAKEEWAQIRYGAPHMFDTVCIVNRIALMLLFVCFQWFVYVRYGTALLTALTPTVTRSRARADQSNFEGRRIPVRRDGLLRRIPYKMTHTYGRVDRNRL